MHTAMEIARYVIDKCTRDNHPISNMQLQKLLYCIQKSFLQKGGLVFRDDIEAWLIGPVVREVYHTYCGYGASRIRMRYEVNLESRYREVIDLIIDEKRDLNPWEFAEEIYAPGSAWGATYENGQGNHRVIPLDLIREKEMEAGVRHHHYNGKPAMQHSD